MSCCDLHAVFVANLGVSGQALTGTLHLAELKAQAVAAAAELSKASSDDISASFDAFVSQVAAV